jgi:hypothetical protein
MSPVTTPAGRAEVPGARELPGQDLVDAGLRDLAGGVESIPALLVASFSQRLRDLGYSVPAHAMIDPEVRLYRLIEQERLDAHAHYNALRARLVSFAQAAECAR